MIRFFSESMVIMMFNYTLKRSKRKTLALLIHNGVVEVRAPLRMPKRYIEEFILSKTEWITKKLAASNRQQDLRENFNLNYGDQILYRGWEYPILEKYGNKVGFDEEQKYFYLPPDLNSGQIMQACIKIYRTLAKKHLTAKTSDFAELMSLKPSAVKINSAKTRWGSCSSKKNINFSWRLIMASDEVIDYVVVHELAHIKEMNHSERFWAVVEGVLPDFKKRKKQLRELQKKLMKEDWG
ncbi:MAG: M48 family metallopeptidase [Lachnospiraceae bacterium]|nr:M48 family metallopeptidase [Lachnospiraceae bacterium]